ncbi:MAG TPA: Ig-like domain-containing protein, partial [Candidatus Binatia bacterium]|nr:Ig-like domain-containing protein [Candidatus Binatia bacterium]
MVRSDEVEVFNRALDAQEIQDIFNAGSAGKCKVQTPATLTLTPPAATNPVGTQHCVTATVQDAAENPVSSVAVQFAVAGSVNTDESVVTDANGQATLCYSGPALPGGDTITAFADTDGDTVQDSNEPGDAAAKTWVTPAATLG